MSRFVQFTSRERDHVGEPLWVNVEEIAAVRQQGQDTRLTTSGGDLLVDETIENSLSMITGVKPKRRLRWW